MEDTFLRTLGGVLGGARRAEDMCRVVVQSAVEDALLCVARDFGHDYGLLLRRYRDDVVARHVSGSVGERTTCRGTGKGGKACGKSAVLGGLCHAHAAAAAEERTKRRVLRAYAAAVPDATSSRLERVADALGGPDARDRRVTASRVTAVSPMNES